MSRLIDPAVGEVFTVPYPFVSELRDSGDYDEEGVSVHQVSTWRPGIRPDGPFRDTDAESSCDAMGAQVLTVRGVFRVPGFPTRVAYTRRWRDPDGREFGKSQLRIRVLWSFREILRGYRIPFLVIDRRHELKAPA